MSDVDDYKKKVLGLLGQQIATVREKIASDPSDVVSPAVLATLNELNEKIVFDDS